MIDPFSWIFGPLTTYRAILVGAILVLAFLTVVLLVVLIVHKTYVELREARSVRLREDFKATLRAFLGGRESHLPHPASALAIDALTDIAIDYMTRADRDVADSIRNELRGAGIVDGLLERLNTRRSWIKRYRALERLGFLRLAELRPVYVKLLEEEKDVRLISKALWALSFVAGKEDLPLITDFLGNATFMSAKFNEYLFTNLIGEFRARLGDGETVALIESLLHQETMPVLLKRDIVESCGKCGFTPGIPLIIDMFHRYGDMPEIRITTIRALGGLSTETLCDIIVPALSDPDWRVRLVASQNASICAEACIPSLSGLMGDQNYYVRLNAAKTLLSLGGKGKAALNRALAGTDRFARDISHYVLGGTR